MRYALIQSGRVVTVVEQDAPPIVAGKWVDCTALRAGPGFKWDGSTFTEPPKPAVHNISTAAFWDRFTNPELVDYDVAMQHDPAASNAAQRAAARLRIFRREASDAGFVNLAKNRVAAFVQGLEGGVLQAGRAATILGAPITDDEAA